MLEIIIYIVSFTLFNMRFDLNLSLNLPFHRHMTHFYLFVVFSQIGAANAAQPIQSVANNRTDSPNSTENNSNLNNNQVAAVKRVRTKTTPMRNTSGVFISDDANVTISVSLTKLGADQAELSLTTEQYGKISYDALTDKRKQEVQSSLLKDDVWLKMLKHLKTIRPTVETMQLFKQILPVPQHKTFMQELQKVYGTRI